MQAPGDNSITVVDPHVQTYADNNLNEKNLATQYIYTTEGQLIPTTAEQISTNMDLNSQHYNTVHVTEAQGMHIQQVDYQYQQQYPDGTVQQVVPVSGTAFVQDQTTAYVIDQTTFIATQEVQTTEQQAYPNPIVTEETSGSTAYVYDTPQEQQNYVTEQSVATETEFINEYAADENGLQNTQQVVENSQDNVEPVKESLDSVSENVEGTVENAEPVQTLSEMVVSEKVSEEIPEVTESVAEVSKIPKNVENDGMTDQAVENAPQEVVKKDSQLENEAQCGQVNNGREEIQQEQEAPVVEKVSSLAQSSEVVKEEFVQQETVVEQKVPLAESTPDENEQGPAELLEETTVAMGEDDGSQEISHSAGHKVYLTEIRSETESRNSTSSTEPSQTPRPRGRKPKTDIPLHILGHDVNKPMENIVNGKTPKPRLGVKVPYRNLTSQIVSKAELEKEIVERGRKRQEEKKEEILFARQLTSRLAKKIAPETSGTSKLNKKKENPAAEVEVVELRENEQMEVDGKDNQENQQDTQKDSIENDSDLLAILEGDGDAEELPVISKETESEIEASTPTDETNLKNLEREIALQQLQDLPYLSPSTRFLKGKIFKPFLKELTPSLSEEKATKLQSGKTSSNSKQNFAKEKSPLKGSLMKQSLDKKPVNFDKRTMEVEPQIKVNMALKTYSRKRKSSDSVTELVASPSKKTPLVVNTTEIDLKPNMQASASGDVYVTKSSRIIKKKVIWDPDESIPSRLTPVKPTSVKVETPVLPKLPIKPVQPKNENRSADLPKKSAVEPKIKTERKVALNDSLKLAAACRKANINTNVKSEEKPSPKKTSNSSVERRTSPGSKAAIKPKKTKSEVDRLLGDEGAIKMLYDLKTSEEPFEEKRKKTVFSVEKTFKELAKKANQIKSDLVNTTAVESPKSLRKKEPIVSPVTVSKPTPPPSVSAPVVPSGISRQKSKDSSRSTPPPSPAFSFPNETSYLIRRRSSSSISSGDETGGSVEFDDIEDDTTSSSELSDIKDRTPRKKAASSALTDPLKIKKSKKNSEARESERSQKRAENRIGHFNTFSFKKLNKSITIDLYAENNTACYFTSELLRELTTALNKIAKEKDCNVVLIRSSQSGTFSRGLNYKELISDKESIRKNKASDLAEQVSNFIQCLLDFPKILIAGIQGECIGLAVTMLPLFDIVISSDNATFSTPYSTLGCVAEAGFLLTVPHLSSHGLAGELFYASQTLTADEAFRRGLISKLCWPEKYNDTLKTTLASIAKGSKQSLESIKKQLRLSIKESTEEAVDSMSNQLIDYWTSSECQTNFAKLIE